MQTGPYCIQVSFVIYTIIVEQTVAIVTKRLSHTQKMTSPVKFTVKIWGDISINQR